MSDLPSPARRARPRGAGGLIRIADLPRFLAIQAARQNASLMARLFRAGDAPCMDGDDPARMVIIFADRLAGAVARRSAAGAFNVAVAAALAPRRIGEGDVYRGT